jgi:hypothetical protein
MGQLTLVVFLYSLSSQDAIITSYRDIYTDKTRLKYNKMHLLQQMHKSSIGLAYLMVHPHACKIRWRQPTTAHTSATHQEACM